MISSAQHVEAIKTLFVTAEDQGILLWLESGWAIDARVGEATREHEDIDVAFPETMRSEYLGVLKALGYDRYQEMPYGFLTWKGEILLDSEPCHESDGEYNLQGFPDNSCPLEKEGRIDDFAVRCLSWEAVYYELLAYAHAEWKPKDFESLRIIEEHLGREKRAALQECYERRKA